MAKKKPKKKPTTDEAEGKSKRSWPGVLVLGVRSWFDSMTGLWTPYEDDDSEPEWADESARGWYRWPE